MAVSDWKVTPEVSSNAGFESGGGSEKRRELLRMFAVGEKALEDMAHNVLVVWIVVAVGRVGTLWLVLSSCQSISIIYLVSRSFLTDY